MIFNSALNAGITHIQENTPCQDYIIFKAADSRSPVNCTSIADGCSGAKEPLVAAEINCRGSIDFFADLRNWNLDEKKLTNRYVEYLIECLENSGKDYDQLAATVAAVAIRDNGDYIAVSLGDCTIISFDNDFSPNVFCEPFTEIDGATHFTNQYDEAIRTLLVRRGNINTESITGFALFTDGCICLTKELLSGGKTLRDMALFTADDNTSSVLSDHIAYITANKTHDDAAIALMLTDQSRDRAKSLLSSRMERQRLIDIGLNAERTERGSFSGQPPMYDYILPALNNSPLTAEELVNAGVCQNGKVLSTMKPLVEMELVTYTGGKFVLSPSSRNM